MPRPSSHSLSAAQSGGPCSWKAIGGCDLPALALEKLVEAPPLLVWKAWTDPDLFARWYGLNVETIVHRLNPRFGGLGLVEMRRNCSSDYQRLEFLEAQSPRPLAWLHSASDANGNIIPSPPIPGLPLVMLTTVVIDEEYDGTSLLRFTASPDRASADEIACFEAGMDRVGSVWEARLDRISKLLGEPILSGLMDEPPAKLPISFRE